VLCYVMLAKADVTTTIQLQWCTAFQCISNVMVTMTQSTTAVTLIMWNVNCGRGWRMDISIWFRRPWFACDKDFQLTTFSEVEYLCLSDKV